MPTTIALPKGRMSEESLEFLHSKKLCSFKEFPKSRELIFKDEKNDLEFLLIRSQDVGTYVEQGAADLGVIGFDLMQEHKFEVFSPSTLPFGDCNLCIAYPENKKNWSQYKNLKVATKYPKITTDYFHKNGYNIQIIKLYGSIEIAPITGISDIIVDLVSTGQTLKANNLTKGESILFSTARLIVNPSAYVFKRKKLNKIIDKISE